MQGIGNNPDKRHVGALWNPPDRTWQSAARVLVYPRGYSKNASAGRERVVPPERVSDNIAGVGKRPRTKRRRT